MLYKFLSLATAAGAIKVGAPASPPPKDAPLGVGQNANTQDDRQTGQEVEEFQNLNFEILYFAPPIVQMQDSNPDLFH